MAAAPHDHDHDHAGHGRPGHDHSGDGHGRGHHHHHVDPDAGDGRVLAAVVVNVLLTLAQAVGGILAGSLALVADAIHNLSDAISLGIAYAARKIARRPANPSMSFGYFRAETVAALVNYTTLIIIGLYLVYEAILRFFAPEPVAGWTVVIVAGVALVIDLATAALTYRESKTSVNIRAAFLHNVADALGSVGVLVAGTLVILFNWWIVDPIVTIAIAAYILWMAFAEIGEVIRILMLGAPPHIDQDELARTLCTLPGVEEVHHLHLWQVDERRSSLEAHLVLSDAAFPDAVAIKRAARALLAERFGIRHATLEAETVREGCAGQPMLAGEFAVPGQGG